MEIQTEKICDCLQEHTVCHYGKRPAEFLFTRKTSGKLPDICESHTAAQKVRNEDAEEKGKAKLYADGKGHAQYSKGDIGDRVLIQQDKVDKLSSSFHPTTQKIVRQEIKLRYNLQQEHATGGTSHK